MSDLKNGMLVQHASLGLGKVVAIEPKAVHVFFATSDARFASKLRLPMALPLLSPAASTNAWLSGLSQFTLDKSGRYALASAWLSHAEAVPRFLEVYPKGFKDPRYLGEDGEKPERAARWRRAHALYEETLAGKEGERLLTAGDIAGLVERALAVEKLVRPLHRDVEKTSFEAALKDLDLARDYFEALFELLAAPALEKSRFDALAAAVAAMMPKETSPEARWPIVTLMPFVARPDLHMLLRPKFASEAAERLGLELAYRPEPNWSTYSALLRSADVLLEKLKPIGARDHVDVDAFMHVVTTKVSRPKVKPALAT